MKEKIKKMRRNSKNENKTKIQEKGEGVSEQKKKVKKGGKKREEE